MSGINVERQAQIIRSYVLNIRSQDGFDFQTGLKTGFLITLFQPLVCLSNEAFQLSLSSLEFPFSFFTTDSTNNLMYCVVQNTLALDNTTIITITIPLGNYTAYSLRDTFTTLFNAAFANGTLGIGGQPCDAALDLTYSLTTNKYTFKLKTNNPSGTIGSRTSLIYWSGMTNTAFRQFGFSTTIITSQFDDGTLLPNGAVSDNVVNVSPKVDALYLRTSLTSTHNVDTRVGGVSDTLQKVPINVEAFFWVYYDYAQTSSKAILTTNVIQDIRIRATDSNDNLINTNDIEWSLSLQFDVIRKPIFNTPRNERRLENLSSQGTPNWLDTVTELDPLEHSNRLRVIHAASSMNELPKEVREQLKRVEKRMEHDPGYRQADNPATADKIASSKDGYVEGIKKDIYSSPLNDIYLNQPEDITNYQMSYTTLARAQDMKAPIIPQVLRVRKPEDETGNLPTTTKGEEAHKLLQERYKKEGLQTSINPKGLDTVYGEDI